MKTQVAAGGLKVGTLVLAPFVGRVERINRFARPEAVVKSTATESHAPNWLGATVVARQPVGSGKPPTSKAPPPATMAGSMASAIEDCYKDVSRGVTLQIGAKVISLSDADLVTIWE